MHDPLHLAPRGKLVLQMAFPAREVLALSITAKRRPVQYRFHPSAHAAGGFRLALPERQRSVGGLNRLLKNRQDPPGIDGTDRQVAQDRIGIGGQRVGPLLRMLVVLPARTIPADRTPSRNSGIHRQSTVQKPCLLTK